MQQMPVSTDQPSRTRKRCSAMAGLGVHGQTMRGTQETRPNMSGRKVSNQEQLHDLAIGLRASCDGRLERRNDSLGGVVDRVSFYLLAASVSNRLGPVMPFE